MHLSSLLLFGMTVTRFLCFQAVGDDSQNIYDTRLAILRDECKRTDYTARLRPSQHSLTNILVDEKYSFMYCRNKKVGTSFWSRMANSISGRRKYYRVIKLDDYHEREDIFHNLAIQFMFVRNPYERAVSAYVHKFLTPLVSSWAQDGEYIERVIRGNQGQVCGNNVTFPEFIKYIIYAEETLEHMNAHFYPMARQCWPCEINYNIIAKFETFEQDARHILGMINTKHNMNLKYENYINEEKWSWTDLTVKTMFRNQKSIEKCMSFHEAMRRVWRNFQVRGFIGKNISLPFGPDDPVDTRSYMNAFGEAKSKSGSDEHRKHNKVEALLEAYSMVPMEDLEKLAQAFKTDCDLFGYDCRPPNIFNRTQNNKPLEYFNI